MIVCFPPPGCAFHPRCREAVGICSRRVPVRRAPAGGAPAHTVSCHVAAPAPDDTETGSPG